MFFEYIIWFSIGMIIVLLIMASRVREVKWGMICMSKSDPYKLNVPEVLINCFLLQVQKSVHALVRKPWNRQEYTRTDTFLGMSNYNVTLRYCSIKTVKLVCPHL